jgi:lipopolysaccharide export system protein LptA
LEGLAEPDAKGKQAARLIVGRGNVNVLAGGTTAFGRTLEVQPEVGVAKLFGDARIRDAQGREGIPAKEITYDMKKRIWRMDQAPDPNLPGQVVRPKIFLGQDFTLPQVKSLDKGR